MALGDSVQYAGEYKLVECTLFSSTGVRARLDSNVIQINIYENIFASAVMINLTVTDQNNMIINMPIVGQEFVSLKIETPGVGTIDYSENKLCVHKYTSREDIANGTQIYELSLVSPEALRNNRTRVSKSYTGTNSDIVTTILQDKTLLNTSKDIHVDETSRIRRFVAPNVRPNEFISYLTRESTSKSYGNSPHYFFYENSRGFQFRCLDSLYDQPAMGVFFGGENMDIEGENKRGNLEKDFQRMMAFAMTTSNDTLLASRGGMLSSNLIKYNIFHKNYEKYTFNYFDNFEDHSRIDENPIYNQTVIDESDNTIGDFPDANIQLHPTSFNGTNDAQFYDTDTGYSYSDNHAEEWILSRRSRMTELSSGGLRVNFQTHGYCNLAVGEKVQLTMPVTGKDHGNSKIDTFYQGDFLVTQLRHSFDQSERKHIMYISATKDSIPAEFTNVAKSTEPVGGKGLIKTY